MDYKKYIIKFLEDIEDEKALKSIYQFVHMWFLET